MCYLSIVKYYVDYPSWSIEGEMHTSPSKGIHIIRYSDGTTKKVYTR